MSFAGIFTRSKSEKNISKNRSRSLSPARPAVSTESNPDDADLAQQRRIMKEASTLSVELKARLIAEWMNLPTTDRRPNIPNENDAMPHIRLEANQSSLGADPFTTHTPFLDFYERERAARGAAQIPSNAADCNTEFFPSMPSNARQAYNSARENQAERGAQNTNPFITAEQRGTVADPYLPLRQHANPYSADRNYHLFSGQGSFNMSQALQLIPRFDGNPDSLSLFSMSVRQVLRTFGPEAEPYILLAIANKLTGRAADAYTARLLSYPSVEAFLAEINMQYSNVEAADDIRAEIKILCQNVNESAGDFGCRMQKLLNRLITIYDSARTMEHSDREFRKRCAEKDALENFMFGLHPPLDHQVRSTQPLTLAQAIRIAVEFECKQSARRKLAGPRSLEYESRFTPTPVCLPQITTHNTFDQYPSNAVNIMRTTATLQCSYCNSTSHNVEDCKKKIYDTSYCDYCEKPGHTLSNCFSLQNDVKAGRVRRPQWDNRNNNQGQRNKRYNRPYNNNRYYNSNNNGDRNNNNNNNNRNGGPSQANNVEPVNKSNESTNDNHPTDAAQPLNSQDARYCPQVSSAINQQ
jgi:hypothetical protein